MLVPGRASRARPLSLALACAAVAGCGGSGGPPQPIATRVCQGDLHAIRTVLSAARLKIADSDPANIECVVFGDGLRADVVAQASPRAWTQFDTLVAHAAQAFAPGGAAQSSNLPRDLSGLGYSAAWIAAKRQLLATNGTQSSGGSFVTVTFTGRSRSGASEVRVAELLTTATLSLAPRGPSPGPAPS